jgi:Phage protein (N4 Gp49/phage Sf6 gene 66) family
MESKRADGGANIVTKHYNISGEPKMGTGPDSLRVTDNLSKAVQKTENRVSLDSLQEKIVDEEYIHPAIIPHMTICILLTDNGYALVGKSAPADADNFDKELGRKFAKEDCIRQMWSLEAYLLRERMSL